MSLNAKWVPMYWPCGPIEAAKLSAAKSGSAELKKITDGWAAPSTLQLLKGTPVNCLIVDWALGTEADEAQQAALKPLIAAGRRLGLSFVGRVAAQANQAAAVSAGRAAGLDAVLLKGPANRSLELPPILEFPRESVDWDRATAIFCASGNVWPGVELPTMRGNAALGGPTGNPWVNSNGWFALLSQKLAADKSVWLEIEPPESPAMLPAEDYCLAIADSRVYGARWILSLDGNLRAALLNGDAQATNAWKRITQTLSFFERHAAWESYHPLGVLAVVSDFRGRNAFMAGEVLNLLNRRQVQFVILDRRKALTAPVTGLKAILWADDQAPSAGQHGHLLAFIQQGGVVIAPSYWGPAGVSSQQTNWLYGYDIYGLGKGRIVVKAGGFTDPYQLARDAHVLVGREYDFARLYNPGTTNCYISIDSDRHKELVQIVNYFTKRPAQYVALWVNSKAPAARLLSSDAQTPAAIEGIAAIGGTDFELPAFSVNCAVEIERLV